LIDRNDILTLRALKGSAIVLLTLGVLKAPTGPGELAIILEQDEKTMRKYLRSLEILGLAHRVKGKNGWLLTANGQEFLTSKREILPLQYCTFIHEHTT